MSGCRSPWRQAKATRPQLSSKVLFARCFLVASLLLEPQGAVRGCLARDPPSALRARWLPGNTNTQFGGVTEATQARVATAGVGKTGKINACMQVPEASEAPKTTKCPGAWGKIGCYLRIVAEAGMHGSLHACATPPHATNLRTAAVRGNFERLAGFAVQKTAAAAASSFLEMDWLKGTHELLERLGELLDLLMVCQVCLWFILLGALVP